MGEANEWALSGQWADETELCTDLWDLDTGAPTLCLFSKALQVWALLQQRDVTVNEAALTFNVPPDRIREAIEEHPWMYLDRPGHDGSDIIGHDGE